MTDPDAHQQPPTDPQQPAPGQAPYPGQPYPGQPPYPHVMMVQAPPTSGWAIASLIFGLLGLVLGWCTFAAPCVVAVICGHAGLIETRGGAKGGRGMAITGLILGYLLVGPIIASIIISGGTSLFQ